METLCKVPATFTWNQYVKWIQTVLISCYRYIRYIQFQASTDLGGTGRACLHCILKKCAGIRATNSIATMSMNWRMNHDHVIIESIWINHAEVIISTFSEQWLQDHTDTDAWTMLEPLFAPNLNRSEQCCWAARGNFPAVAAASGPAFNASKCPNRWEPANTSGKKKKNTLLRCLFSAQAMSPWYFWFHCSIRSILPVQSFDAACS